MYPHCCLATGIQPDKVVIEREPSPKSPGSACAALWRNKGFNSGTKSMLTVDC